jgi:hypothetical protein
VSYNYAKRVLQEKKPEWGVDQLKHKETDHTANEEAEEEEDEEEEEEEEE